MSRRLLALLSGAMLSSLSCLGRLDGTASRAAAGRHGGAGAGRGRPVDPAIVEVRADLEYLAAGAHRSHHG